jgi:hypothetical protein
MNCDCAPLCTASIWCLAAAASGEGDAMLPDDLISIHLMLKLNKFDVLRPEIFRMAGAMHYKRACSRQARFF